MQRSDIEGYNLKQLHDVEVKDQYEFTSSNSFVALENLIDIV
jgi:hypothetical protein